MSWKTPKTVLGNKIEWDTAKIPGKRQNGTWSGKDDQLWRCRKTKRFEASLLNNLPHGACFVDAGAHFGDTVITMAIYARDTLQRHDIRFVAFEPNRTKAQFIEECAEANGFDSDTLRVISCVLGDETLIGGAKAMREHAKDWCKFDGRTSYSKVTPQHETLVLVDSVPLANQSDNTNISDENSCSSSSSSSSSSDQFLDIHQLDDYCDLIHPIGFLHIDVEGWEAHVLSGASKLLTATADSTVEPSQCYILAETFNHKEARRRGPEFSQTHEEDILQVMNKFSFSRGEDVVDGERNLFFARVENQPLGSVPAAIP
eukprot:CAMPEP_0172301456 /NCGR_PEP_ID=MMETSP1058-20130122/3342_1 /TAXON_ID=83371 /ORGANISM="Detonula confervacea, Strain CCMP 353" /LENGTH=315 /DNA_ID=CAMNT_0013011581 /DNA_START=141 /DNA_END=1088 /DNA_ORIENTATION=+